MFVDQADELGCKNAAEMIAGFRRSDCDIHSFKNAHHVVRLRDACAGNRHPKFRSQNLCRRSVPG
jgi:hypothetical protein